MTKPPDPDADALGTAVRTIAGRLGARHFPRGALAAFRRMDPESWHEPAFWALLAEAVPADLRAHEDQERRWALIVHAMALMVPHHHNLRVAVGRALVGPDWRRPIVNERRLNHLLSTRDRQFRQAVPRLARLLLAHAQPLNWGELAYLIWDAERPTGQDQAEKRRLAIARSYFGALHPAAPAVAGASDPAAV